MLRFRRSNRAWIFAGGLWIAIPLTALLTAAQADAAPLRVGPNQMYASPCAAVAAAKSNDTIEIASGTYTDSCAIAVMGLTLRGVGGQPKIDLSATDHPAQYKAIYVVAADDVTIENLELTGAHVTPDNGENAAGIRVEAKGLTVRGCKIHDNQNGILGGTAGTITIEHSEFFHNGVGDGCNNSGCTHNVYIANIDALYFRFNWSHAIATDTPDKGHLLKSRAKANYIQYNRLTGEDGFDSYEIDLPNGGFAVVVGNVIEKGKAAGNSTLLSWGEEGANNPDPRVFVVNNTFVNDFGSGKFISASGATLSANNNLFVGAGTISSSGALSADNLSGIDPSFVERARYDYHLMGGSLAIGKGVAVGLANQVSLTAVSEYLHPLGEVARTSTRDVGAFEFGTNMNGAMDGGVSSGGAGSGAAGTGGGGVAGTHDGSGGGGGTTNAGTGGARADAGSGSSNPSSSDGGPNPADDVAATGCGCSIPGSERDPAAGSWLLSLLATCLIALRWRRRSTRRGERKCSTPQRETAMTKTRITTRAAARWISWSRIAALFALIGCSDAQHLLRSDGGTAGNGTVTANDSGTHNPSGDGSAADAGTAARHDASSTTKDAGGPRDAGGSTSGNGAQGASTDGGGTLCPELGWCELTNTKLESVCPDAAQHPEIQANEGCSGVINDWSGGVSDEKRNRLLIWGGGHRGYFGNEVYALDLNKLAMQRLNEPSDIQGVDLTQCMSPEAYADGRPSSRHTYDGLAYFPEADKILAIAGAGIPCGYAVHGTWTLDLAAISSTGLGQAALWTNMNPDPYPTKANYGVVADYDPNSKRVVLDDTYNFWSYDLASNTYTLLNDSNNTSAHIDYHMTGRVDPKRKLFVVVGGKGGAGGGMQVFDIGPGSSYAQQDWTGRVSGCDGLLGANSPGFAYDPVQDRMIGWAGGDTVYAFDPDSKTCATNSYAGGPGAQNANGTFGRFRYFPALRVFAVVNDYRKSAYSLRLTK